MSTTRNIQSSWQQWKQETLAVKAFTLWCFVSLLICIAGLIYVAPEIVLLAVGAITVVCAAIAILIIIAFLTGQYEAG